MIVLILSQLRNLEEMFRASQELLGCDVALKRFGVHERFLGED